MECAPYIDAASRLLRARWGSDTPRPVCTHCGIISFLDAIGAIIKRVTDVRWDLLFRSDDDDDGPVALTGFWSEV